MIPSDQVVPDIANCLEFVKNLNFYISTVNKPSANSAELLQKVLALKFIHDHHDDGMKTLQSLIVADDSQPCTSASLGMKPITVDDENGQEEEEEEEMMIGDDEVPEYLENISDYPICFNSMSIVLENLRKAGVDSVLSENIALERLSSQLANPMTILARVLITDNKIFPIATINVASSIAKALLLKMHNHEKFNCDGAPFPFDVKTALRYSERLHSQIVPLQEINPLHIAHEQSITLTALARFMAMHEHPSNNEMRFIFNVPTAIVDEHAYHSAIFWTYREAFKAFYYPQMPAPLPTNFHLTPVESHILNRYWNAGNRHVTVEEAMLLSKRCPSLAPYQIYGYFDKRRRREYHRYCHIKDQETLARETTALIRMLKEMKKQMDDDMDEEEDAMNIQREFLSRSDRAKLLTLYQSGVTQPSRNECELWAAELDIGCSEQIFAFCEDRRWREAYHLKRAAAAEKSARLAQSSQSSSQTSTNDNNNNNDN